MAAGGDVDPRIPVGGIIMYPTTTAPSGWELYNFNQYSLRMAETSGQVGTIPSNSNIVTISGTTDVRGNHLGTGFYTPGAPTTSFSSTSQYFRFTSDAGSHSHTMTDSNVWQPDLVRHPMIRKITDAGVIPENASVFALGDLPSPLLSEVSTYINRVIYSATDTIATAAQTALPLAFGANTSTNGAHDHGINPVLSDSIVPTFGPEAFNHSGVAGGHSHSVFGNITSVDPKYANVAQMQALGETLVPIGTIIAYDGDDANINKGWRLCDGTNGTLDLRDHYLRIVAKANAGKTGDNTVTWTATSVSTAGAHNHKGGSAGNVTSYGIYHSDSINGHTHAFASQSGVVNLRARYVRFIQFLP